MDKWPLISVLLPPSFPSDGAPWPGALTHVFKAYYQFVLLPPHFLPLLPGSHINHLLKWQPTPVVLPGQSHGWRSLVGYSPRGRKELDTTEQPHFHFPESLSQVLLWENPAKMASGFSVLGFAFCLLLSKLQISQSKESIIIRAPFAEHRPCAWQGAEEGKSVTAKKLFC